MKTDPHAALDGSKRHFHEFGNLCMRVSLEIREFDRLALFDRKVFECLTHIFTSEGFGDFAPYIGTVGSVHARLQFNRLDPALTSSEFVDRTMMNDAQYP